jgi:hypothetical protein
MNEESWGDLTVIPRARAKAPFQDGRAWLPPEPALALGSPAGSPSQRKLAAYLGQGVAPPEPLPISCQLGRSLALPK